MKTLKKDYKWASLWGRTSNGCFSYEIRSITWAAWHLHRLLEYLQAMRNYFLLEAGDTMYDFYTAIFDKVQEKEIWQQPSFLNVQLQEAVGQRYPEDGSRYCTSFRSFKRNLKNPYFLQRLIFYRLSVCLEPIDPSRKKHPVNNLEVLTLSYKVNSVEGMQLLGCYSCFWNSLVHICLVLFSSGSLASWHSHQLWVSEDLQSSVSTFAADKMGQIQFGHTSIRWYELGVQMIKMADREWIFQLNFPSLSLQTEI